MDIKTKECLENKQGSYILPFLWLHGEPKERVRQEILAIKNSGLSEFCAESRPYEDFCKEQWWDDFGFILETARELNMGVWLLDDRKFPTGYANGYLEKEENESLRKMLIREFQIDAVGPMNSAKLYVGGRIYEGEKPIKAVAYKYAKETGEALDYKTAVDLTDKLSDGMVYWDIPEGNWRVCVTVESKPFEYKDNRFFYYIDMLNKKSCHAMIDAIYEPHYEHFSEYFGTTFKGFFSDEPGFLNVLDTYYNKLGIMNSPYPWSYELPRLISESAGISEEKVWLYLPAMWEDLGEITSLIRGHYMETVTKLYSENFSYLLGDWCREHGVMYIGHVIEDMGAHTRLGYGSGHYFRALDGQDMAGIDIVLAQDIPGVNGNTHRSPLADGGAADPAFFRYTLPKLASSHSHIQPLKKGRAMCEIFGAFGWAEGLPFMKGLADIMLVGGINHFVPHAFSPTEEDEDCPPHFYNGGKNIQYPMFKSLMGYMGRCAHMISEGTHKADVAVFYNAEGEWTGGKNQLFYTLCRHLTRSLIDFDIVPYDAMKEAKVKNGRMYINGEDYGALIVSQCDILHIDRLECFASLSKSGLPVIFTDSLPIMSAEGIDITSLLSNFKACPLENIAKEIRQMEFCQISGEGEGLEDLRFYHITRDKKHIYLFSNEGINKDVNGYLTLKQAGECLIYEPWENKCYKSEAINGRLKLHIEKGNMLFVIFGGEIPKETPYFTYEKERMPLDISFNISVIEEGLVEKRTIAENSGLFDISSPDKFPDFSGTVIYEGSFVAQKGFDVIDLGQVGEACQVKLNGKCLGERINAPYKLSLKSAIKEGENKIEIAVKSNLGHKRREYLSSFIQIPPTGILGEICLCKYE